MVRITKAEFIRRLQNSRNCLLDATYANYPDERFKGITLDADAGRSVTQTRSNHLEFSDGSRLYFDGYAKREYYDHGNNVVSVAVTERGSTLTKCMYYLLSTEAKGEQK